MHLQIYKNSHNKDNPEMRMIQKIMDQKIPPKWERGKTNSHTGNNPTNHLQQAYKFEYHISLNKHPDAYLKFRLKEGEGRNYRKEGT